MYVEFVSIEPVLGDVASQSEWEERKKKWRTRRLEDRCTSFSLACHVREIGKSGRLISELATLQGGVCCVLCVVALCGAL